MRRSARVDVTERRKGRGTEGRSSKTYINRRIHWLDREHPNRPGSMAAWPRDAAVQWLRQSAECVEGSATASPRPCRERAPTASENGSGRGAHTVDPGHSSHGCESPAESTGTAVPTQLGAATRAPKPESCIGGNKARAAEPCPGFTGRSAATTNTVTSRRMAATEAVPALQSKSDDQNPNRYVYVALATPGVLCRELLQYSFSTPTGCRTKRPPPQAGREPGSARASLAGQHCPSETHPRGQS